ncbi:SapB/AmfS family lanthipeptide [Phytohabitans sp. LJ34]|uniref:SapB/AmfS family lanthipeptide n=1 Tax=Phytohabitans sp. LJ34 TaxID=3452217 RepID=UPI003F88EC07
MALLDLQAMETKAFETGGDGGGHGSSASASCPPSNVSLTLCHESNLSLLLCHN